MPPKKDENKICVTVPPGVKATSEILTTKENRKMKAKLRKAAVKAVEGSYGVQAKRKPSAYNGFVKANFQKASEEYRKRNSLAAGDKVAIWDAQKIISEWWADEKKKGAPAAAPEEKKSPVAEPVKPASGAGEPAAPSEAALESKYDSEATESEDETEDEGGETPGAETKAPAPAIGAIEFPEKGLVVKPSPISGKGLFATRDFKPKEKIAYYVGPEFGVRAFKIHYGPDDCDYVLEYRQGRFIDGAPDSPASYANDCRSADVKAKKGKGNNARFVYNTNDRTNPGKEGGSVYLSAMKKIKAGEEITVSYGRVYWNRKKKNERAMIGADSDSVK